MNSLQKFFPPQAILITGGVGGAGADPTTPPVIRVVLHHTELGVGRNFGGSVYVCVFKP